MTELLTEFNFNPLLLSTSCFSIGHLKEIKYYTFLYKELQTPSLGNTIYEVESDIRKGYPTAIMFVYTKEIYLYDLNCENNDFPSAHDRFVSIFSSKNIEIDILSKGSFNSRTIFNNSSNTSGNTNSQQQQQHSQNKSLPLVYINFLKAVKRFIVWKLAEQKDANGLLQIIGFGNHAISCTPLRKKNELLLIDPIYNFSDELMINVCTRDHGLQRITTRNFTGNEYSIYLAPSAVRVYLANEDLNKSILEQPPQNYSKLLTLLKNYCNIDLFPNKSLKWIKVIPNLNHLNHLTPNISHFLREISNGLKYIVWPLDLCFIQKGIFDLQQVNDEVMELTNSFGQVFNIIEEFIEYNNEVELTKKKEAESISAIHTPASLSTPVPPLHPNQDLISETEFINDKELQQVLVHDFADQNAVYNEPMIQETNEDDINMENWDTELFGNNDDEEEEEEDQQVKEEINNQTEDLGFLGDSQIDDEIDKYFPDSEIELDSVKDQDEEEENGVQNVAPTTTASDKEDLNVSFIDTSKFINAAGTDNFLYEDPGAPAPIPFAIIAEKPPKDEDLTEQEKKKSVFAPLNFNPAIEQSIDSKYLNGGKFYVSHDGGDDSIIADAADNNNTSFRSYTPVTPSLRKNAFDSSIIVSSSDDESDSSDEDYKNEDEDEDDEDDAITLDSDSKNSKNSEENKQTGLGIINFKKDELLMDEDRLNGLGLSSPSKKAAELALLPNFISQSIMLSNSSTPSPVPSTASPSTVTTSENQNWLPFLLKLIPLYTIPPVFFYSNPKISKNELDEVLPMLLKMFAFDSFNDNSNSVHQQEGLPCLKFSNSSTSHCDLDLYNLLDKSFPGITRTSLSKLIEQNNEADLSMKKCFECLTGSGLNNTNGEAIDMVKTEFMDASFSPAIVQNEVVPKQFDPDYLFQIPQPTISLNRLDQDLKINLSSLGFWNLLNLQPAGATKDFQTIMILPRFGSTFLEDKSIKDKSSEFLNLISEEYSISRLGQFSKFETILATENSVVDDINIATSLESGVYEICCDSEVDEKTRWQLIGNKMNELARNLKNQPVFQDSTIPTLVLMVNPFNTLNSFIEIGKLLSRFNNILKSQDLDVKEDNNKKKKRKVTSTTPIPKREEILPIFTKVLSLDTYYSSEQTYTVISNSTLNKISLDLYNLCPISSKNDTKMESLIENPFTTISPALPSKVNYKLTKASITKSVNANDLYIHLAYERSIDKNWCVASWSDQYGKITNIKAWYCPPPPFGSKNPPTSQFKSFEDISNEIWEITLNYIRLHTGKSYLVLTRLNNIIPDDELVHWKRLSLKTKNLLLIVLAMSLNSNFLLSSVDSRFISASSSGSSSSSTNQNATALMNKRPDSVPSNTGLTPFLFGNGDSPEAYMTSGGGGAGGTPADINSPNTVSNAQTRIFNNTDDVSIVDVSNDCCGVILPNPIPLSNQQNRISIKTGFLLKVSMHLDQNIGGSTKNTESFTPTPYQSLQQHNIQHNHQTPHNQQQHHHQHQQQPNKQHMKYIIKSDNILEINLMSCPNFINGLELVKELLTQYRNLSSLADSWGMNEANNLHMSEGEELMIPWHILSVRKCLNALVHVDVVD